MLIWDDALTLTKKFVNDNSTDGLVTLKMLLNLGYHTTLGKLGRDIQEQTKTSTTVATQQYYQLPNNYLKIKAIKITVGTTTYNVEEEESQEGWDALNMTAQSSDIPSRYFIRNSFGHGGSEFGIYPIPSSSANVITIVYEATDKDLSQTAYTTGTIAVENGSATITGTDTTFTKSMVGRYFAVTDSDGDGMWYKIASYTSPTVLVLENVYEGETDTGSAYKIAEAFGMPDDVQILPLYWAAWHYFMAKQNTQKVTEYKTLYDTEMILAKRRYSSKSRNAVLSSNKIYGSGSNPPFFPTNLAS